MRPAGLRAPPSLAAVGAPPRACHALLSRLLHQSFYNSTLLSAALLYAKFTKKGELPPCTLDRGSWPLLDGTSCALMPLYPPNHPTPPPTRHTLPHMHAHTHEHHVQDCAYLCNMAVDRSFQRRGVAGQLVAAAERLAALAGRPDMYLHLRLRDASGPAGAPVSLQPV